MKAGTKEFYDVQTQFEQTAKSYSMFGTLRFDKETDAPAGFFYQDGRTNELFHAFMLGYGYGRILTDA